MLILTFHFVCNPNLHVLAKFCRDAINGCGDMANFQFKIWRPSAILNFGNMQILTCRRVYSHNLHVPAKFCRNRLRKYCKFSISMQSWVMIGSAIFVWWAVGFQVFPLTLVVVLTTLRQYRAGVWLRQSSDVGLSWKRGKTYTMRKLLTMLRCKTRESRWVGSGTT